MANIFRPKKYLVKLQYWIVSGQQIQHNLFPKFSIRHVESKNTIIKCC